ncbi:hypothetical protein SAMN06296036_11986 [Pseudobacteriovorax antillogorgiicola]|uniref:Uncharacterized protein n=1 Tax=Pseudobacteriovorax antillogorgiicola TaxID=1513793 RepID=A0A1Y6CDL7_9BACT|nr:hypothetical protein EDD56_11985 [Pseudobacteriovorax antillogorgiicola]SMF58241.1 hypothetical protein SAMN06296036_11986 [Pseudobacteriovorax antillogorgiicola]
MRLLSFVFVSHLAFIGRVRYRKSTQQPLHLRKNLTNISLEQPIRIVPAVLLQLHFLPIIRI